jgi:hypothetical protein
LFCDRIKIAIIGADVGPFPFVIRPLLSATYPLYLFCSLHAIDQRRARGKLSRSALTLSRVIREIPSPDSARAEQRGRPFFTPSFPALRFFTSLSRSASAASEFDLSGGKI